MEHDERGDDLGRCISFAYSGIPRGKGRPRHTRAGRVFTPSTTRAYERDLAWHAAAAMRGREPLQGPLSVALTAIMPVPRSWPAKRRRAALAGDLMPTGRPDLDNQIKALDAGNGILWGDDAQIVRITAEKRYGAEPGLLIEVAEIGGPI